MYDLEKLDFSESTIVDFDRDEENVALELTNVKYLDEPFDSVIIVYKVEQILVNDELFDGKLMVGKNNEVNSIIFNESLNSFELTAEWCNVPIEDGDKLIFTPDSLFKKTYAVIGENISIALITWIHKGET